ncbi:MAG: DUF1501 domain-containing protein [Chroococcidiopsidaceae cyanobacterium CP_BM_ER_R8_30]|nr:DUF1501 domain-containing protein [Chroococcidiopsidaceae cyanobacterium CP_BM_ER_R8_30]
MNRRKFLQQVGIASTSAIALIGTHGWAARGTSLNSLNSGSNPKRLVVIFLRGAVDGLNVVVPHGDTAYYEARPKIAIPRPSENSGALDLDGHFGLHPALASLMPLWQQGSLAFVDACGSPNPTRSHFEAQDYMESGTPGVESTPDGWMNRLLATLPNHTPVQAVNFGDTTPRILSGRMSVASFPLGHNSASPLPLDKPQVGTAFDRLYSGNDALSLAYQEGRKARKTLLTDLDAEMQAANNGAPLPIGFASDAQKLAQLMVKDPSIDLAFLALGGWDTHVNQGSSQGQLAGRLKALGDGLATLAQGLGPVYRDTAIVVMSEFGRTVHENGDGGTDHGHGNAMWILGGSIKGGKIYGEWPGLANNQLYQGRDLAISTDFRDVIISLLECHLQLDDAKLHRVFPDYNPSQKVSLV